ncbi:MAG: response regulator [Candidatus Bathyarchaeota archaeon]|nr:response regulator [Candidatus Bathyarchaeota archaeon]
MKKAKILIIEDDKFLNKLYSDKLNRSGLDVLGTISAEEGLNRALMEKPDLILLDLVLPQKSGFEVLSELKLSPETKKIPVVILTNLGQETDMRRGLDLGAVAYLVKTDFSVNQLPELVKEYLAKAEKK